MVPVKVLSFRERGLSSSRFHCDSTLLVARWPRGEVRKERKMHRIVGKNISISDSFSQEKKERKKRVASLLFLPYSIPLIDQRSARPIIIKTAPLLPSLRDARAAKRRHAAKGKLFSSGKLQTGGRGANCVHANPAGWKLPGGYDTYLPGNLSSRSAIIAREIHLSWFIAPVDKYVRVNPSSWLRFFFFHPSPIPTRFVPCTMRLLIRRKFLLSFLPDTLSTVSFHGLE